MLAPWTTAILLVMARRLAVRGGEVAGLDFRDVSTRRAAEVTVRRQGQPDRDVLPLPADVGEAIAAYLLHAWPSTASRALFVTMVAPFARLGVPSVTCLTSRACARAGVARFGPHGLRLHAAACELLLGGASMEEIGQLLRHAEQGADHGDLREGRPGPSVGSSRCSRPRGAARVSLRQHGEDYLALRRALGRKMARRRADAAGLRGPAGRCRAARGQRRQPPWNGQPKVQRRLTGTPGRRPPRHRPGLRLPHAHDGPGDGGPAAADLIVAPQRRKPPYIYSPQEISASSTRGRYDHRAAVSKPTPCRRWSASSHPPGCGWEKYWP